MYKDIGTTGKKQQTQFYKNYFFGVCRGINSSIRYKCIIQFVS